MAEFRDFLEYDINLTALTLFCLSKGVICESGKLITEDGKWYNPLSWGSGPVDQTRGTNVMPMPAQAAGTSAGAGGGAALGGTLGTLIAPGVGTLAGAVVGGLLGGRGASAATKKLGDWLQGGQPIQLTPLYTQMKSGLNNLISAMAAAEDVVPDVKKYSEKATQLMKLVNELGNDLPQADSAIKTYHDKNVADGGFIEKLRSWLGTKGAKSNQWLQQHPFVNAIATTGAAAAGGIAGAAAGSYAGHQLQNALGGGENQAGAAEVKHGRAETGETQHSINGFKVSDAQYKEMSKIQDIQDYTKRHEAISKFMHDNKIPNAAMDRTMRMWMDSEPSRITRIHGELQRADPTSTAQISAMAKTRNEVMQVMNLHNQGWTPQQIAAALAKHKGVDLKTLDVTTAAAPETAPTPQSPSPPIRTPRTPVSTRARSGSTLGPDVDDNF